MRRRLTPCSRRSWMPAIELDLIIAFLNRADRLHSIAARVFEDIAGGRLVGVAIPSSALLELELVLRSRGAQPPATAAPR